MTDPAGSLRGSRGDNPRVPMAQRIRLRFEGQRGFIVGLVFDLSVDGMAIRSGFEAAEGTMLQFEFDAPGSAVKVQGQGRVAWRSHTLEAAGERARTTLGVKFVSLAEPDRAEVERIVAAEVVLKAELEQADSEVTRIQLVSEQTKKIHGEQLEAKDIRRRRTLAHDRSSRGSAS